MAKRTNKKNKIKQNSKINISNNIISNQTNNSKNTVIDNSDSQKESLLKIIIDNPIVQYNMLFAIGICVMLFFFIRYGKLPIWKNDGLYQHYNAFLYYGQWWRDLLHNIFVEHKFVAPVWEWSIGYGADVITTLSYYVFGDPFALISVITPREFGEVGFVISIILRMYVAGLAFGLYCQKMNCRKWSTILATMMYVFSCYAVYAGVRHPYFISPMIYLPLVLFGCEKILRKESSIPFVLAVALSALSNFYFFYMIVLITIIYVVLRLLCNKENRTIKYIMLNIFKFGFFALIGLGISSILLLPNVMNFFGNTRITGSYKFNWLYTKGEYEKLLGSFVGVEFGSDWAIVGMCPLAYLTAGLTAIRRKKEDRWSVIFLFMQIIFLLFPVFGFMFNGFGYVCNRWVFAWVFLISYMFARSMPDLLNATKKERNILGIGCALYCMLCLLFESSRTEDTLIGCIILFVGVMFLGWTSDMEDTSKTKLKRKTIQIAITTFLVVLFVAHSIYYRYSVAEQNYLEYFQSIGTANVKLSSERLKYFNFDEEGFYRIDNSLNDNEVANYCLCDGNKTTTSYWSLTCPEVVNFMKTNSTYKWIPYSVKGLGNRAWILPLISAKYFVTSSTNAAMASVPYGYYYSNNSRYSGKVEYEDKAYMLYETDNVLPFGYTFNSTIAKSEFDNLTYAKKQQAMLQGAVVDDKIKDKIKLKTCETRFSDHNVQTVILKGDNIEVQDNALIVKKSDAGLTIEFTPLDEGEIYLQIKGLHFESKLQRDLKDGDVTVSAYDKKMEEERFKYWQPAVETEITAVCHNNVASITHNTDYCKYAEGREDYLISLGNDSNWRSAIKVKFEKTGIYTFDDISVIYQPMGELTSFVNKLKKDTMSDVEFSSNKVTGNIQLDENKLLCFSMPYSKGWKVYVDGEERELICTNIMFAGVMLEHGKHNIELRYCTPYLKQGALISVISLISLVLVIFYEMRAKKKL